MEKCARCQASLDPAWKFCVACGTPVRASTAADIPADAPDAPPTRRMPDEPGDGEPQNQRAQNQWTQNERPRERTQNEPTRNAHPRDEPTRNAHPRDEPPRNAHPRDEPPRNGQAQGEHAPSRQPTEKPLTRAAMKAESSTVAAKAKRTRATPAQTAPAAAMAGAPSAAKTTPTAATPPASNIIIDHIPAAIRNSQDGPPDRAPGRRRVDVALIVSIGLGVAGAALIVYLVILVFGSRG